MLEIDQNKSSLKGFVLHASAVVAPSGVALFAGASGAGKSTIASLLKKHMGWPVMADDATHIWNKEGMWVAEDGCHVFPILSGGREWPFSPYRCIPVAAWFSIRQALKAEYSPISRREACRHMVQAWLEVEGQSSPYSPIKGMRVFPDVASFACAIPAMMLNFTKGLDTVRILDYVLNNIKLYK